MIKLPDGEGLQERVRVAEQAGPGPRLRAAREASGFEIDEIAKQLRLHPQIIEDLERDKFSDHLALVFVRGYLRAYAGLIGLNPEQVIEEFNALGYQEDRDLPDLKGKPQSKDRMRAHEDINRTPMNPGMKWGAIVALIAALGGIFIAYTREPEVQLNSVPLPIPEASETENALPNEAGTVSNSVEPSAAPAPTTAPATAAQAPAPRSVNSAPAQAPGAATPAAAASAEPAPKPAPVEEHNHDYDDDPDAMNEPQLPRPGRNS
jgi:cytoskeleton protein RodZ